MHQSVDRSFALLLSALRPNVMTLTIIIICSLFVGIGELILPYLQSEIIGVLSGLPSDSGPPIPLIWTGEICEQIQLLEEHEYADCRRNRVKDLLALAGMGLLLRFIMHVAGALIETRLSAWIVRELQMRFAVHLLQVDIAWYDKTNPHELNSRFVEDVQAAPDLIDLSVRVITSVVTVLASLAVTTSASPLLSAYIFAYSICSTVAVGSQGKILHRASRSKQDSKSQASGKAGQVFPNIRTVRSFSNEDFEAERFGEIFREIEQKVIHMDFIMIMVGTLYEYFNLYADLGLVGIGSSLVLINHMNVSQLVLSISLGLGLRKSFLAFAVAIISANVASGKLHTVASILDMPIKIPIRQTGASFQIDGMIQFIDVAFSYPSRPNNQILAGVTLTFEACKSSALCGPSGSGKSSVISLIERFYDPNEGIIKIGDVPLRHVNPVEWRRQVALVSQEPVLFAGTISSNIAYSKHGKASSDEIIAAATTANAHHMIIDLPFGYEAMVGERGTQLSGGQKQRIAIARAALLDPRILLLDEATSALDTTSEQMVQQSLAVMMQGKTTISIAHRMSTIRSCDTIFVLAGGHVKEQGSHQVLMDAQGLYYNLVFQQEQDTKYDQA